TPKDVYLLATAGSDLISKGNCSEHPRDKSLEIIKDVVSIVKYSPKTPSGKYGDNTNIKRILKIIEAALTINPKLFFKITVITKPKH
ncbi:TPA: hypothetical protein ACVO3B_004506, partial [Vibrio diabolicus]